MRAPTTGAFGDGAFDVGTVRADVGIGPYGVCSAMVHATRRRGRLIAAPADPPPVFPSGEVVLLYVSVLSLLAVYLLLRMRKFSDVRLLALLRSEEL